MIPFIRVMDSLTLAISQGSLRRGSAAVYLPVWHSEIEEFIDLRRATGGDPNCKTPNLHPGVLISDAFMRAVETDELWPLLSPKDESVVKSASADSLGQPGWAHDAMPETDVLRFLSDVRRIMDSVVAFAAGDASTR